MQFGARKLLSLCCVLQSQKIHHGDAQFCSSAGHCNNQSHETSNSIVVADNQVAGCPVSDCDAVGTLQHHLSDEATGSSVACIAGENDLTTYDNGYLRCFSGLLCSTDRVVESVYFRVKALRGTSVPVTVNIFKGGSNSCDTSDNVAILYEQTAPVVTTTKLLYPQQGEFPETVQLPQPLILSRSESLLVEISVPSLVNARGSFFLGDSNGDQCGPSYIQTSAIQCSGGTLKPRSTASIGYPNVSFIIAINTSRAPTTAPSPGIPTNFERGCFLSVGLALSCLFDYLFGWLLPF